MSDTAFDPSAIRTTDESIQRIVWFELPEGVPEMKSKYHDLMIVPTGGRIDWSYTPQGANTRITFFSKARAYPGHKGVQNISLYYRSEEEIGSLPAELRDPVLALLVDLPRAMLPQD